MPFSPRTAQAYIQLHEWSLTHVVTFQNNASLGIGKLRILSSLPPAVLSKLLNRKRHRVPPTGYRRTLAGLTLSELRAVVRSLAAGSPHTAAELALSGCRRGVAGISRAADALVAQRATVDQSDARSIHESLLEVAEQLAAAFELD